MGVGEVEGRRIRGLDRGLGRAKHPCLAARPTKDGRPYPGQVEAVSGWRLGTQAEAMSSPPYLEAFA